MAFPISIGRRPNVHEAFGDVTWPKPRVVHGRNCWNDDAVDSAKYFHACKKPSEVKKAYCDLVESNVKGSRIPFIGWFVREGIKSRNPFYRAAYGYRKFKEVKDGD